MTLQIADGQTRFGCSLEEFYRRPDLVVRIARRGILIPPLKECATEATPGLARVNPLDGVARWIVDCPDCKVGVEYVWLQQPFMFCMNCGNKLIGGKWRPVKIPGNRKAIERLLLARPDPDSRAWNPNETVNQLKKDNELLGVGSAS